MARKKERIADNIIFYDVLYTDGTRSSRRKINAPGLDRSEADAFALTEIMNQDRRIAEMSGKDRGPIKELTRSA